MAEKACHACHLHYATRLNSGVRPQVELLAVGLPSCAASVSARAYRGRLARSLAAHQGACATRTLPSSRHRHEAFGRRRHHQTSHASIASGSLRASCCVFHTRSGSSAARRSSPASSATLATSFLRSRTPRTAAQRVHPQQVTSQGRRGLTIHSSRRRFTAAIFSVCYVLYCGRAAARLNSGVRHQRVVQ